MIETEVTLNIVEEPVTVDVTISGEGPQGAAGPANTLSIGTVQSGATAAATITGSSPNQTLNLTLPKGDKGDTGSTGATGAAGPANTLSIGTVTGGQTASATITGTAPNQTLNLVLPKGDKGDTGSTGQAGVSPEVTVTEITGGHTVSITDAEGTQTFDVMDGVDGADGEDGAPGAAAGFGTPTASVDANVGTPSVTITASGADTSKVFDFAFHNLKGQPGSDASVTASNIQSALGYTPADNDDMTQALYTIEELQGSVDALTTAKEDTSNKVTSITSSSTNTQYPSAKCVYDSVSQLSQDKVDKASQVTKTSAMTSEVGIDADGKLWSAAGGGGGGETWRLVRHQLFDADASSANINKDDNNNSFSLKKAIVLWKSAANTKSYTGWIRLKFNGSNAAYQDAYEANTTAGNYGFSLHKAQIVGGYFIPEASLFSGNSSSIKETLRDETKGVTDAGARFPGLPIAMQSITSVWIGGWNDGAICPGCEIWIWGVDA